MLRKERDGVSEEEDRLKREHGKLRQQMGRWAAALNSIFKTLSVDLETLGVPGGRVIADSDLTKLMGVVEGKFQKVWTTPPPPLLSPQPPTLFPHSHLPLMLTPLARAGGLGGF